MLPAINFGAVLLLAVLALALPALAHRQHWNVIREDWRHPLRIVIGVLQSELGTTITYFWPVTGTTGSSTTAPAASVMASVPEQSAQVFFADTDTFATIINNWGLPASFNTALFPMVIITKALGASSGDPSFVTNFTVGLSTNSVTLTKPLGAGTGGTYNVNVLRPMGPWLK